MMNTPVSCDGMKRWPKAVMIRVLLVLATFCLSHTAMADQKELPVELQPYVVELRIGFDLPAHSRKLHQEILDQVRSAADRCIGSQWQLTVSEETEVQPVSAEGLSRLSPPELNSPHPKSVVRLFATIHSDGARWRLDVRSFQPVAGFSDVSGAETYDRLDVPLLLLQLSYASFRPIGVIEDVEGKRVRIVMLAGAMLVPDPAFSLATAGSQFAPILMSRKRDGTLDRLQSIPWTYLSVSETSGARSTCDLHSGLRTPIGGRQRGRVETLAIAVKGTHPETRLELATQSKPSLPLVAHRIELRRNSEIPGADDPRDKDDRLLKVLMTDRRGHVTLVPHGTDVVWLFAYSGRHLLARVPMIPGSASRMRLEVPDDSSRLEAESNLHMLQGQLIEAVAARNTITSRLRAAVKKNDAERARSAAQELRKQPDAQQYLDKVTSIRVPAVKAANSRRDRAGEARINRMCDEMSELIKQYLNEDKRQAVLEELKELYNDDDIDKPPAEKK